MPRTQHMISMGSTLLFLYFRYFIVSYTLENEGKRFQERSQEESSSGEEEDSAGAGYLASPMIYFDFCRSFDDWSEPFVTSCSCFFCDQVLSSPSDLFFHLSNQHKFDILQMKKQWSTSDHHIPSFPCSTDTFVLFLPLWKIKFSFCHSTRFLQLCGSH